MKLSEVSKGQMVEIVEFADNTTKCMAARFGLAAGQVIKCIAKVGPIIISKNHQVIAIGKNLSNKILVKDI